MIKKEELNVLLGWAKEAQKIFTESGETEFQELRRREKIAMLHYLEECGLEIETDGDSDGSSESVTIKDETTSISVVFFSAAYDPDDFDDNLNGLQCNFDDKMFDSGYDNSDLTFDEFVDLIVNMTQSDVAIINLTPHAVTFYAADGETIVNTVPSSGVARAEQSRESMGDINGIPVSKTGYGKVEGLPKPAENTIYIVSVLTAQAAKERNDLYIVDDIVRDTSGQILGCKALAQIM